MALITYTLLVTCSNHELTISMQNIVQPNIGAANTPYARSVRSQTVQPASLPDPGTIFDSVMVRKDFTPHPNKISSVLFYLASIIIHGRVRSIILGIS